MRKFVAVFLCSMMLLSLLSCNAENTNGNENIDTDTNTSTTEKVQAETDNANTENNTNSTEASTQENTNTAPSIKSKSQIAMEAYVAALKSEIKVYETDIEEYTYLKDCKTPYAQIPLCELESLEYVYVDFDGDFISELVINCGDTLILRYYEGTVYLYPFTFRDMYQLNTDGSYSWNSNRQNFEYGENQLYFEGAELKTKELWRIVNDGEPNTEYYIGEKQVTKEKLLIYVDSNPKTKVEFSQFELSSSYPISADQAWNLANAYWNNQNGAKDHGAGTIWTARIVLTDTPNFDTDYYRFDFRIESTSNVDRVNGEDITPYYIKSYDQILVNAFTGEITTPECEAANGKCISIDDAIEISKNYRDYIDFDKEGNNYLVELDVDGIAPPHFYVISTQKLVDDHYADYSEHWIDKYTGEVIYPFYMYGKG